MTHKAEEPEELRKRDGKKPINKKFKAIVDGWKHVLLPFTMTIEQERIAKQRAEICSTCPINVANICSKTKGGCGCPLVSKTKSFEGGNDCPKEKWNSIQS